MVINMSVAGHRLCVLFALVALICLLVPSIDAASFSSCSSGTYLDSNTDWYDNDFAGSSLNRVYGTSLIVGDHKTNNLPIIRLARGSDYAEKDFYSDWAGNLWDSSNLDPDTDASPYDFMEVVADTLYVMKWYDQGGNDDSLYAYSIYEAPEYDVENKAIRFSSGRFLSWASSTAGQVASTEIPFYNDKGVAEDFTWAVRLSEVDFSSASTMGLLHVGDIDNDFYDVIMEESSSSTSGDIYAGFNGEYGDGVELSFLLGGATYVEKFNGIKRHTGYYESSTNSHQYIQGATQARYVDSGQAYFGKTPNSPLEASVTMFMVRRSAVSDDQAGAIGDWGHTTCTPCPAGYESNAGSTSSFDCNIACIAGQYNDDRGLGCIVCPTGRYSDTSAASECTDCGDGYYTSLAGSSSITDCAACVLGKYYQTTDTSGYNEYCRDCRTDCYVCPAGEYASSTGTVTCDACPSAKYSDGTIPSTEYCEDCSAGYGDPTMTGADDAANGCGKCQAGTYSDGDGVACQACPAGQDSGIGAAYVSSCSDCPQGRYADGSGVVCSDCFEGYYCPNLGTSDPRDTPCSAGEDSPSGSTTSSDCNACNYGYHANSTIGPGCTVCGHGTYNADNTATSCTACPNGKYGYSGSLYYSSHCQSCTNEGMFAPAGSGYASDCEWCGAGFYTGQDPTANGTIYHTECTMVPAGYARESFGQLETCRPGYYAPNGMPRCIECDGTTYNTDYKMSECYQCPDGEIAVEAFGTTDDANDDYTETQTIQKTGCEICPPGTFANIQNFCELCPQTTYSAGGVTECALCPGGRLSNEGSTSEEECVSPDMNFVTGYIVLAMIIPLGLEYLVHARNHRVAFLRQERVTKSIIKQSKAVMGNLYHYVNRARAERKRDFKMRTLKTWLFITWALVVVIIVSLFSFIMTLSQVYFRSMIVFRGFKLKANFEDVMEACVHATATILDLPLVGYLFYPVVAVFVFFSTFTLDVEAIDITCEGAQAPLELFINLIILGLTIVVIESDYQIFRAITFNSVTDKFFECITQPCYQAWAFREGGVTASPTFRGYMGYAFTGFLTVLFRIVGGFDLFQSFLQYCMSLVVWKTFAAGHASTPECDAVDGWEYTDTIIATIATVQAFLLLTPAMYEIAKVFVPGLPRNWRALDDVDNKRDPKTSSFHLLKYFSIISLDLWMAALSSSWINQMRHRTPHETGKNSKTLRDMEDKDAESKQKQAAQERSRAIKEGHVSPRVADAEAAVLEAHAIKDMEGEIDDGERGGEMMKLDAVSTKMVSDASTGKRVDVNELEKGTLPAFRVVSLGHDGICPAGYECGFYIARPGYSIKVWALYPIDATPQSNVYVMARVNRNSGRVDLCKTYDVYTNGAADKCDGRGGAQLVEDLNGTDAHHLVVLYTLGDPGQKRLEVPGLLEAIKRCGGSFKEFGTDIPKGDCPAYCLIGVPGAGEGRGFERMTDAGRHAVIDVAFEVTKAGFKLTGVHVDEVEEYYCLSSNSYLLSMLFVRDEQENYLWKQRQKETMPSYWTLCRLEMLEMNKSWLCNICYAVSCPFCLMCTHCCSKEEDRLIPSTIRGMGVFFHIGHVLTDIGRRATFITFWKLYKFLTICLGVWTEDSVHIMHVHEQARTASVVFEKPIRKKSAKAYATYRLNASRSAQKKGSSLLALMSSRRDAPTSTRTEKEVKPADPAIYRVIACASDAASQGGDTQCGLYRAGAAGWDRRPLNATVFDNVYVLVRISRRSGKVQLCRAYDVVNATPQGLCEGRNSADLVGDMVGTPAECLVVLFTLGDLGQERANDAGLVAAIKRCGGSSQVFSESVPKGSAYCLIGVPGAGEGRGFERMSAPGEGALIDKAFEVTAVGFKFFTSNNDALKAAAVAQTSASESVTASKKKENNMYDEDNDEDDWDIVLDEKGNSIHLRKESSEMREVQQEELKRKLRSDYALILDAVVCCRSTLLQIIPELCVLSIFACTTATSPIFVFDKHLRKNLPEILISEPFAEARTQEREYIEEAEIVRRHEMTEFDHDIPNPQYETDMRGKPVIVPSRRREEIEKLNVENREGMKLIMTQPPRVVNEWMVFMTGISLTVTESRGVAFFLNLYKFILTVGILLSPPELLRLWMLSAIIILLPYAIITTLSINVMLGRAMDITDTDLHHTFTCIGLGCLLRTMTYFTGRPLNIETEEGEDFNENEENVSESHKVRHHDDSDSEDENNTMFRDNASVTSSNAGGDNASVTSSTVGDNNNKDNDGGAGTGDVQKRQGVVKSEIDQMVEEREEMAKKAKALVEQEGKSERAAALEAKQEVMESRAGVAKAEEQATPAPAPADHPDAIAAELAALEDGHEE